MEARKSAPSVSPRSSPGSKRERLAKDRAEKLEREKQKAAVALQSNSSAATEEGTIPRQRSASQIRREERMKLEQVPDIPLHPVETAECIYQLRHHTQWVKALAPIDKGRLLASSGMDNSVCIWDTQSGEALNCLEGHTQWVSALAALPGGRIVSGCFGGVIRVWGALNKDCVHLPEGHTGPVLAIVALEAGRFQGHVVSASWDRTIKIWDVDAARCVHTLEGHLDRVRSLAVVGEYLASGCNAGVIKVWELEEPLQDCLHTFAEHSGAVCVLATVTIPDGTVVAWSQHAPLHKMLASGGCDNVIRLWDLNPFQDRQGSGGSCYTLTGHQGYVLSLCAVGTTLASGSFDNTLKLWECTTGICTRTFTLADPALVLVALRNGIASGGADNVVRLYGNKVE